MSPATTLERRMVSRDAATTRDIAARLAPVARPGDLICVQGPLGSGKTQFAKGFGAGLGIVDTINSPTFILMAEYAGRLPLFHLDLYRLADAAEAVSGGLVDDRQAEGVTLVEWPERMGVVLPAARLDVTIEGTGDESRDIVISPTDGSYARYLEAVP